HFAIGLRNEMIERAVVGPLNLRVALLWFAANEVSHGVVAFERHTPFVRLDERLAPCAVANDEAGPILVRLRDACRLILVEKVRGLLVVLKNQPAINDLEPLGTDGRETVNARRI